MKKELEQAYALLSPYSYRNQWEFGNNLSHLNHLTKYLPKKCTIFDAGCGIGVLILALKLLGYQVAGGDKYLFRENNRYSINDLNRLKKIWEQNELNIYNLDLLSDKLDKKYDAVISIATLEHQSNPGAFLKKLKELVKYNGYIYIATPNIAHLLNRLRFLFGRSPLVNLEEFYTTEKFVGHFREYTLKEIIKMFELENIEIIMAKTEQELKPNFSFKTLKNLRFLYVNFLRLLAYIIPNTGDANILLGKIK